MPTVVIEGTEFLFDIERTVLIEKGALHNEIDFQYMDDLGTHYGFMYSSGMKNHSFFRPLDELFGQEEEVAASKGETYVKIPRIAAIDPEGMCRKYGCTTEDLRTKSDFQIMVDQQIFVERLKGIPVTIEFPGKTYLVDVAKNVLEPIDGIGEDIRLNMFHYDYYYEDFGAYHLFYNIKESRAEDPARDGTWGLTADRVVLEVPSLSNLDPIGANISSGRNPRAFLANRELKLAHVPKVVEWSFYGIKANNPRKNDDKMMELNRELPKYQIGETEFIVDVKLGHLTDSARPDNILKLQELQFYEGKYIAYLDSDGRKAVLTGNIGTEYEIPQMVELDPEGIAALFGKSIEEIRQLSDFELLVDQELFNRRMDGELPQLEILGTTFMVDSQAGTLTSDDSQFFMYELEPYLKDDFYEFPYNTASKTFTDLDFETITAIPANTSWVRIPLDWDLDPVGWAKMMGLDPKDAALMYPLKAKMTAELIAWDKTKIYEIMTFNRNRQGTGLHEPKPEKKSAGRKKGRGI